MEVFGFRKEQGPAGLDQGEVLVSVLMHAMSERFPGWFVTEKGLAAPGGRLVIQPTLEHDEGHDNLAHVDFSVYLWDENRSGTYSVSDCVVGMGPHRGAALTSAVVEWVATSGQTILEIVSYSDSFAVHSTPRTLPRWHSLQGDTHIKGDPEGVQAFSEWTSVHRHAVGDEVLPFLDDFLSAGGSPFAMVKVFYASIGETETAEVAVNHHPVPEASTALSALSWPRSTGSAMARTSFLLLRQD